eukprot:g48618.t1
MLLILWFVQQVLGNCTPHGDGQGGHCTLSPYGKLETIPLSYFNLSPIAPRRSFFSSLFEVIELNITSTHPIKVFWHGGTDWEPVQLKGWNSQYCWPWYNVTSWFFSDALRCNVKMSRLSKWYPLPGESRLEILEDKDWSWSVTQLDIIYPTTWTLEINYMRKLDTSFLVMLLIGSILYLIAPLLGYSRVVHISLFTLLGSTGAILVILIFLFRMLPQGRRAGFGVVVMGGSSVALMFKDWIYSFLFKENLPVVVGVMAAGALLGFMFAYRFEFEEKTRSLLTILLRMSSFLCIVNAFTSLPVAVIYFVLLVLVDYCRPSLCGSEADGDEMDKEDEASEEEDEEVDPASIQSIHRNVVSSSVESERNNKTPISRAARQKFLESQLGPERASLFYVRGSPEYLTSEEDNRECEIATEQALRELRKELRSGSYTNRLSASARKAAAEFVAIHDESESDHED